MILRRLQVEEGFLDGLNVTFEPGLNVVIGARGTGKTSIVELLRFGLGADDLTERRPVGAESHALSVLRGGRVSIRLEVDGSVVDVVRAANDREPRANGRYLPPIVLAQNEIEHVGVELSCSAPAHRSLPVQPG